MINFGCNNVGMDCNKGRTHIKMECQEQHVQSHQEGTLHTSSKLKIKLGAFFIFLPLLFTRFLVDMEPFEFIVALVFLSLSLLLLETSLFLLVTGTSTVTGYVHIIHINQLKLVRSWYCMALGKLKEMGSLYGGLF